MHTKEMSRDKRVIINWLKRLGVEFKTGFLVVNSEMEDLPIVYTNEAFCTMTGYSEEEILGRNGRFLHGPKTDPAVSFRIRESILANQAGVFEIVNYHKDGAPFWNEITVQPLVVQKGNFTFTLLLQKDITERKRAEALIKLQQETYIGIEKGYMLSYLLQNICNRAESFFPDGAKCSVVLIDDTECFTLAAGNSLPKKFSDSINGVKANEWTGTCGAAFHRKETVVVDDMSTDALWQDLRHLAEASGMVASWSDPVINSEGEAIGAFAIYFSSPIEASSKELEFMQQFSSIIALTVKYSRQQEEMLKLAYTDSQTGLPNRNYFLSEMNELLKAGEEGFIVFIAADEFIRVIDQYGHREGDLLIGELGKRLIRTNLASDKVVARFSDSTLAVLSLTPLDQIPDHLEDMKQCILEPILVDDMDLFLTLKMGVAIITPKQQDAEELIRFADSALSKAKLRKGETICYFENEHDEFMMRDLRLANELTVALRKDEVNVHLQPKVDMKTGEILSFEALARWTSPELGNVSPGIFIPAAEKNGKIQLLEENILERVMVWLKSRQDAGVPLRQVAINFSAEHFFHHSFVSLLVDSAERYGIDPKWIQLEITESIGFIDIDTAQKVFRQLKDYGFNSSVDDFGTGFSSLSYLQKLPVSEIKIDRSFIVNMHKKETLAIVRTIIQLAENLSMQVVAEGIETEEQRHILLALGCRIGQGFLFYKPMALEEAGLL
ncbi:MAG TPA: EAL domain-containing protein [Planococcus sp. (in: firmicutes)]|nr:EAL domain-containing protein [Planococcus sp. (in: firmicutes)]